MGSIYHLWLMPERESNSYFTKVIRDLSNEYNTRLYEPHITLAGNISGPEDKLIEKTKLLSAQLNKFEITSIDIQYLNEFYRSLFVAVTLTEPLIQANKDAKQLFGLPTDESYMPHLSLLYGDIPVSEKEKIKKKLDFSIPKQFVVDRITLLRTDDQSDLWKAAKSFQLDRH